jgi:hypothetical protein
MPAASVFSTEDYAAEEKINDIWRGERGTVL